MDRSLVTLPPFIGRYRACFDRTWAEDTSIDAVRFVVLDSETTGLNPRVDRLITIGAVAVQNSEIESMLDREIVELRSLMFQMAPIESEPPDLSILLSDLVEQFGRAANVSATLVSNFDAGHIPSHLRREVARIVKEALVNVRKHSGARRVLVSVSTNGTHCNLIIDDDGHGFDFEGRLAGNELDDRRKGPRTIMERVRLLGGSLIVDSKPNAGSRVEISVPLDA